jgi:hypothetical protein
VLLTLFLSQFTCHSAECHSAEFYSTLWHSTIEYDSDKNIRLFALYDYSECYSADAIMLRVLILIGIQLSAILLSVILLNVMAPLKFLPETK